MIVRFDPVTARTATLGTMTAMGHVSLDMRRCLGLLLFVALTGCAPTVDLAPPPPPTAVPDLRGAWAGTWGGGPVELVIVEQRELGDYSGVALGPVQVLGRRRPGVTGVLTSTIAGAPVSANAEGWLGYAGGRLTLLLHATTGSGPQQLTLTQTDADRWSGQGESEFAWGPRGPIDIVRRTVSPASR
jgi:hypothetical protein